MMIENFEERFKELDSDKPKHKNVLFINPVDPGKNGFWISGTDLSSKFSGVQSTLREVTGNGYRAGLDGLLEGRTSYSLFRVMVIHCEFISSLAFERRIGANKLSLY